MIHCRSYHGDKMKIGNKTKPKVETVLDDDDDNAVTHFYFHDEPTRKTSMPVREAWLMFWSCSQLF